MKSIKDIPEHTRPREKLREKGPKALTDEELVAAILGMGTTGVDVRTIAKQVAGLIREHKETLSLDHLLGVPGMGLAKAAQILSAFELRSGPALLACRQSHPPGHPEGETGGVRGADCLRGE